MHLKHVYIYSNVTALMAQEKVNDMIERYDDENTTVNFDLQMENSVITGLYAETRYTLIIYIFSLVMEGYMSDGN